MRDEPASVKAWIRSDLAARYGGAVAEEIPQDMLAILAQYKRPD